MEVQVLSPPVLILYVSYRVKYQKRIGCFLLSHPLSIGKVKLADEQVDRFSGVTGRGTTKGFPIFPFIDSRVRFPVLPDWLWL